MSKGLRNLTLITAGAAVVVVALLVYLNQSHGTAFASQVQATSTPDTIVVKQDDVLISLLASGALQAKQTAALSFTVTGKVVSIPVELGDHVLKGQIIATLDNTSA